MSIATCRGCGSAWRGTDDLELGFFRSRCGSPRRAPLAVPGITATTSEAKDAYPIFKPRRHVGSTRGTWPGSTFAIARAPCRDCGERRADDERWGSRKRRTKRAGARPGLDEPGAHDIDVTCNRATWFPSRVAASTSREDARRTTTRTSFTRISDGRWAIGSLGSPVAVRWAPDPSSTPSRAITGAVRDRRRPGIDGPTSVPRGHHRLCGVWGGSQIDPTSSIARPNDRRVHAAGARSPIRLVAGPVVATER
jgi:hypothetical protein